MKKRLNFLVIFLFVIIGFTFDIKGVSACSCQYFRTFKGSETDPGDAGNIRDVNYVYVVKLELNTNSGISDGSNVYYNDSITLSKKVFNNGNSGKVSSVNARYDYFTKERKAEIVKQTKEIANANCSVSKCSELKLTVENISVSTGEDAVQGTADNAQEVVNFADETKYKTISESDYNTLINSTDVCETAKVLNFADSECPTSTSEKLDINAIRNFYNTITNTQKYSDNNVDSCSLISGDVRQILQEVFIYISIAGIVILVIMTAISGVKAITGADENIIKNFLKGLRTRIICLILLFLLPAIVMFVISTINGIAPAFGFSANNPLCGITTK